MSTKKEIFVVIKDGRNQYYLLKIVTSDCDVYCIPPILGIHLSTHESGKSHFQYDSNEKELGQEPPVILAMGEAGTLFGNGIMRASLSDLGRASCICTATYPIGSLSSDFMKFQRNAVECFIINKDSFTKDTTLVEIGVWAVPSRNKASFDFNNPDIPEGLLYKLPTCEPQIWIYARRFI